MNIHSDAGGFVVAAGAILGMCAGLLWTAQGSMMMAYPTETQKGKFIGIFWSIFNLGGVVGASVAAGENWKSTVGARAFVTHDCVFIHVYRPTLLIMEHMWVSVFRYPAVCLNRF